MLISKYIYQNLIKLTFLQIKKQAFKSDVFAALVKMILLYFLQMLMIKLQELICKVTWFESRFVLSPGIWWNLQHIPNLLTKWKCNKRKKSLNFLLVNISKRNLSKKENNKRARKFHVYQHIGHTLTNV